MVLGLFHPYRVSVVAEVPPVVRMAAVLRPSRHEPARGGERSALHPDCLLRLDRQR